MNNMTKKLSFKSQALLLILILASCSQSNSQPTRESLPGDEILPGSEQMSTAFFTPFKVTGQIIEEKGNEAETFRSFEKEMLFEDYNGKKAIKQILTYTQKDRKTGVHTTLYDPKTFQVIYWEYKSHTNSTHFAFKANGTKLSGTQNPSSSSPQWQTTDLGIGLFQNETRELLFRSLYSAEKGTQVKFPIIGMQAPFHGWIAYEYKKDESIEYGGRKRKAKIWSAVGNSTIYYAVIDQAPYVIQREVPAGKKSKHVFTYDPI